MTFIRQEKSQLKAGILLNYVNIGLGNLIPIFYTPIMLQLLGKSEYGLYKLAGSVTSYLSLISLGVGSAVTRYLIKYKTANDKDGEERVLGLFMIIFQLIAVTSFLVGCILVFNLHIWYGDSLSPEELSRMRILVFILVCNMSVSFSATPYISVVSAHEKFLFLQCMNIITTCVSPILNIIVLFMGYASIGMTMVTLILGIVVRVVYIQYVKKILKIRAKYRHLPFKLVKEIFSFSIWIFVGDIVAQLYNATDIILIGIVPKLATTGVAVYSIGSTFSTIVTSLTTGVSSLLNPMANRLVFGKASNKELTETAIRFGRIQCYIITLVATGFIAFGRPFIAFYAGEGYEEAYWGAVFMIIPNMVPLVQSMFTSIIIAKNQHRFRSLTYLGIAILNVIGTWLILEHLGIIGAALMTGGATIIGHGFIMNWYYHRKIGLDIRKFWKNLSSIYIVPTIMCVFTLMSYKVIDYYNLITLFLGIVIYTVIFCLLQWKFVMREEEKELLFKPIRKCIRKREI